MQARLIELGYLDDVADGVFGNKTAAAVTYFQEAVGIEATGAAAHEVQALIYQPDVVRAADAVIPWTSLSLYKNDKMSLNRNSTRTLSIIPTPSYATIPDKWTWSSLDENIATVDENGVVKGIAAGKTVVTATASDGTSISCDVTVTVYTPPAATSKPRRKKGGGGGTWTF